ncbi:hypothetical protein BZZ01_04230 [Nostocales cyanobacterium HT-58-2]|nr:hypothetical protein BZZ01_04230 [Nostocales cyanobacterium HT-58-2]
MSENDGFKNITACQQAYEVLQQAYEDLERRVEERTAELFHFNQLLQQEISDRKQAEAQIAFQASVLNQVRNAVIATDLEGKITYWNQFAQQLYELTPDVMSRSIMEVTVPPNQIEAAQEIMACIQEKGYWEGEFIVRRQDSSTFVASVVNALIYDTEGNPSGFVGVSMDISDRKAAEEALRQSEELYRNLIESQTDLIVRIDMQGRLTFANTVACETFGFQRNEFLGQSLLQVVHPEDLPDVMANMQALTSPPYRLTTKEQRELTVIGMRWFQWEIAAIRNQQGQVIELQGVGRDVTERKQAEEKIREQATLLNVASDAIIVRDLKHQIFFWNQGAQHLYGWQSAEVVGKKATELFSDKILPDVELALKTTIEQGKWEGELQHKTKDGRKVIVQSRWTLVRDNTGQPKFFLTVNTDITEKKQLEAQFLRTQRLESLGTLASGIAHDLNNILSPILVIAQLLSAKFPNLDKQNRELLEILENNSKRAVELVKQILSFAGGTEGKHIPLQLRHLLKDIRQIVISTFPKSIEVNITNIPTQNLWTVCADPIQVHQVLMNLCVNARDAMPKGGTLSICADNFCVDENYARMNLEAKVGNYVVITVSDTGCGIPQQTIERIFEPFFTTKEPGKGTGLGLSTVIGIVKNHSGFVEVYSEVGKGSQFKVYLSASDRQVTQNASTSEMPTGNGELILVVDNEASILEATKTSLETLNYKILTANDAVEAFSLYTRHKNQISVVLMDIQMPSLDGLNAIRILQKMNPSIKIIAISGLASNQKLIEAGNINAQAFLAKPYTLQQLLHTIQGVLSVP